MKNKNCNIIRELLPLYAENLVSKETAAYIKEHLAGCESCSREWELFNEPLPDPFPDEREASAKNFENRLFGRLKKTIAAAAVLLTLCGAGLVYASYNAGKHIGLDDPVYRFAQELNLFTEIMQTKAIGDVQVTIEKGLFDSTRSVLFISLSAQGQDFPYVNISDDNGNRFEQKSGRGWQNKYFMLEFEPLSIETQQVNVALNLGTDGEGADFSFPVDVVKTAQYTTIIYPNQEKEVSDLKIALEKAVLGVSETEFRVRFDWPVDGSAAGFSVGKGLAYFPTSVKEASETPPPPGLDAPPPGGLRPGYAASYGVNYLSQDPPFLRPALYDLTDRQEIEVDSGEYKTTQFPCQVIAEIRFAPVKQDTQEMELVLPPLYLYSEVEKDTKLLLDFTTQDELELRKNIPFSQGAVILEKAWFEERKVYLTYHVEDAERGGNLLPHFELINSQGKKQGVFRFDREKENTIMFSLYNEEARSFYLNIDTIGQLLPRQKFALDIKE